MKFSISEQTELQLSAARADAEWNLAAIVQPGGGWEPLGCAEDGSYVVLSRKTGRVIVLGDKDLAKRKLPMLLGQGVRESYLRYDDRAKCHVFDPDALVNSIAELCEGMGRFDQSRVRGPGLYRDGNRLIINFGDVVKTSDGEAIDARPVPEAPVYTAGEPVGFSIDTPCATEGDLRSLLETLGSFGFQDRRGLVLTAGWLASRCVSDIVDCHPIICVTADRGSGKSTLVEFIGSLLGQRAVRRDGVPTAAQVVHAMQGQPKVLLLDEIEARPSNRRAFEAVQEQLRMGFLRSSKERSTRVIGGKLKQFCAVDGALLSGIALPSLNPATESRSVRISLGPLPAESRMRRWPLLDAVRQADVVALGQRLRRLLTVRWEVFRQASDMLLDELNARGHEPRSAIKYATILAGWVALSHAAPASGAELERLVAELELDVPAKVQVVTDAQACLDALLARKMVVFKPSFTTPVRAVMSIRDVLSDILHGDPKVRLPLVRQLEDLGVRPVWMTSREAWMLAISASQHHEGMRKLMQATDWADGGWGDVLARLDGAERQVQRVAKTPQRVVLVPMPSEVVIPPGDEVYDFPGGTAHAGAVTA